jgi:hypothetical protein
VPMLKPAIVPAPMTWINSRLERFIFAITDI